MENNYCVYKHTTPSGKVYIGITGRDPETRWRGGKGYRNQNFHFENAIKKYGWEHIKHEIIANCLSKQEAREMEKFFIQVFKSYDSRYGYNKTMGGETCAIIIERSVIQYDLEGNYIQRYQSLTEASLMSNTSISRISDCANGKRFSSNGYIWLFEDDSEKQKHLKEKVNEKRHPSLMCGGANHQARPIEQYDLDGKYMATYPSAQTAADKLGIDYSSIKSAANKKKKKHVSSGGYIWIHSDEENKMELLDALVKRNKKKGCERAVDQFSLNGDFIQTFPSITSAQKYFNANIKIGEVCNGRRKTAGGYIWKYKITHNEE